MLVAIIDTQVTVIRGTVLFPGGESGEIFHFGTMLWLDYCHDLEDVLRMLWVQVGPGRINRAINQHGKQLSLIIGASGGHVECHFY